MGIRKFMGVAVSAVALLQAGERWEKKDRTQWTPEETQQILRDSGWAKHADGYIGTTDEDPHTYLTKGPSARDIGLGGPRDDEWFPVGKLPPTKMPTLPVTVRWDSSLPVREALLQSHSADAVDTEHTLKDPEKYYVISIVGLGVPRKPQAADEAHDEETRMRQGLLNESRLMLHKRPPIVPEDARVDQTTGVIRIYFPKDKPITLEDKEVAFGTVFGSVRVIQRFRLKDMVYKGQLTL